MGVHLLSDVSLLKGAGVTGDLNGTRACKASSNFTQDERSSHHRQMSEVGENLLQN